MRWIGHPVAHRAGCHVAENQESLFEGINSRQQTRARSGHRPLYLVQVPAAALAIRGGDSTGTGEAQGQSTH